MVDQLFVYGSLMDSQNEFGLYLQRNSIFVSEAYIQGRLYDAVEYPGVILNTEGYQVKGRIFRLIDFDKSISFLDDYEGYGDEQFEPDLFIRRLTQATTDNGIVPCWLYIYNRPVTGLVEIVSGDYAGYKTDKKKSLHGLRRKG